MAIQLAIQIVISRQRVLVPSNLKFSQGFGTPQHSDAVFLGLTPARFAGGAGVVTVIFHRSLIFIVDGLHRDVEAMGIFGGLTSQSGD